MLDTYVPINFSCYHKHSPEDILFGRFMMKGFNEPINKPFPMSNKTIYPNLIMKQVAELCDNGHYPICKNKEGEFAIFAPQRDYEGDIQRSEWEETIENCKTNIASCFQDSDTNFINEPVEIIGFYHPPVPKFKTGDKVKKLVTDGANFPIGEIEHFNVTDGYYSVSFPGRESRYIAPHLLELYLEPAQKVQTINIGGKEYPITPELENALKNLKPIK